METPRYPPIDEYGVIGNLETCVLVSRYGSIDWCPMPDVESPSVFSAILDHERGGSFQLQPVHPYQAAQRYLRRTNVLATDFHTSTGRATVFDWLPFPEEGRTVPTSGVLYRKVTCTEGTVRFGADFRPRFDYGQVVPDVTPTDRGAAARGDGDELYLTAPVRLSCGAGAASGTVSLAAGEVTWFVLGYDRDLAYEPEAYQRRLDRTVEAWRAWVAEGGEQARRIDEGRWRSLVERSALALKLLTHRDTGAIAAAPTTSLPEEIGGTRNWDYRYNWIRDAAMTVQALSKLGHVIEANDYFSWLLSRVYEGPASIRPLYGLHGGTDFEERTLDFLRGYRSSAPVRVGNAAGHQRQLDVYGELVLGVYETHRYGATVTPETWTALREVVDHVIEVWEAPDAGIWEFRTEPRQFVHSKVMCWAALDRGIKLARETDFDGPIERWRSARRTIRAAVVERGYRDDVGCFVQTFGADDALDATALLIPIVGFLPFDDPRVQRTIDAVRRRLTTEEGLVYRYDADDGLPGGEGTFALCSFWLVDALALAGRVEEAEAIFDGVLSHASPLGLLSEEIAAESGSLLGNYPQAFSHIGLINSALYLDRVRRNRQTGPEPLGTEPGRAEDAPVQDP